MLLCFGTLPRLWFALSVYAALAHSSQENLASEGFRVVRHSCMQACLVGRDSRAPSFGIPASS